MALRRSRRCFALRPPEGLEARTLFSGSELPGWLAPSASAEGTEVTARLVTPSGASGIAYLSGEGSGTLVVDTDRLPAEVTRLAIDDFSRVTLNGSRVLEHLIVEDVGELTVGNPVRGSASLTDVRVATFAHTAPELVDLRGTYTFLEANGFSSTTILSGLSRLDLESSGAGSGTGGLWLFGRSAGQEVRLGFGGTLHLAGLDANRVQVLADAELAAEPIREARVAQTGPSGPTTPAAVLAVSSPAWLIAPPSLPTPPTDLPVAAPVSLFGGSTGPQLPPVSLPPDLTVASPAETSASAPGLLPSEWTERLAQLRQTLIELAEFSAQVAHIRQSVSSGAGLASDDSDLAEGPAVTTALPSVGAGDRPPPPTAAPPPGLFAPVGLDSTGALASVPVTLVPPGPPATPSARAAEAPWFGDPASDASSRTSILVAAAESPASGSATSEAIRHGLAVNASDLDAIFDRMTAFLRVAAATTANSVRDYVVERAWDEVTASNRPLLPGDPRGARDLVQLGRS